MDETLDMLAANTTMPAVDAPTTTAVDRLLEAIEQGRGSEVVECYAPTARLDVTVPQWRFARKGGEAIAEQYGTWFATPGSFEELERHLTSVGEVARYLLVWDRLGVPHAAHHCHLFVVDRGHDRITSERVFCGGRWPASLLAEMAGAAAVDGP